MVKYSTLIPERFEIEMQSTNKKIPQLRPAV